MSRDQIKAVRTTKSALSRDQNKTVETVKSSEFEIKVELKKRIMRADRGLSMKNRIGILLLIGFVLIGTGCQKEPTKSESKPEPTDSIQTQKETKPEPKSETEPEPEPEPILSSLTGLPISEQAVKRRPIGVMIDNVKTALPQYGISDAEIIYETLVEGGRTRLMAVFQDFTTEKIGPVRSSRHYFLDFALDHDAIYTHVGQSTKAIKAFKQLEVDRMYGISSLDAILTFQDPNRKRPHSTFTNYEKLMATWEKLEYRQEPKQQPNKLNFHSTDNLPKDGQAVTDIELDYSYYIKAKFCYDDKTKNYLRYQYDQPHMDALNDQQLAFKNIILQYTSIWLIKSDPLGLMDMDLLTEGEGLYISDQAAISIKWKKTDHNQPTQYYLTDGSPLLLNPGKTFISVFPENQVDKIKISP